MSTVQKEPGVLVNLGYTSGGSGDGSNNAGGSKIGTADPGSSYPIGYIKGEQLMMKTSSRRYQGINVKEGYIKVRI